MATGDFIPEIWSATLLKNWDEQFVLGKIVNRGYEGEIKGPGDTLHVNNLGDITVAPYAGTVEYEDIPESVDTLTIDQQNYWAFKVDDILKVQSKPELRNNYTKRAAVALKRVVEQFILGADIQAAAGLAMDAVAMDESNVYSTLVAARQMFEDAYTWIEGEMWMVIPPAISTMIRTSDELIHATETADAFIKSGSIGKLAGFNLVPAARANMLEDGDGLHILAGNREAIHFAEQIVQTEAIRLQDTFATGVRGLLVYGGKVFTQNANCLLDLPVSGLPAVGSPTSP